MDIKITPPPLCFVLMPFGRKTDATGRTTDFDAVYREIIAPAVQEAGLDPIRADEEKVGGTIHKPMFERLMLCDYAVADITGANPNVYYELGIRHAMRPSSTVILFAEGTTLPFDIALLRGIAYRTGENGAPIDPKSCASRVTAQLGAARENPHDDSPLFQLLEYMPRFEVDHSKTDIFRERFDYSKKYKARLAVAREKGAEAVQEVMAEPALSNLHEVESGVVVDLFLSLRDVKSYTGMIELFYRMPPPLQRARIMREQYAFALNREGRSQEAEAVLKEVLQEFGPSSETNGLLGRVYKDRWDAAKKEGRSVEARGLLRNAIDTYLAGFQADWRDAYPGVNAVTLDGDAGQARSPAGRNPSGSALCRATEGQAQRRLLGSRHPDGARRDRPRPRRCRGQAFRLAGERPVHRALAAGDDRAANGLDPGAARKARRGRRRRDQGPGGGTAREAPCARGGAEEGVVTYRRDSYLNSSDLITTGTTLVNSMTLPIST